MFSLTSSSSLPSQAPSTWPRPTFDEYYLNIAAVVATRAACTRSQVGAVLVKDNHVVSLGYNGAPAGKKHCTEGGCPRGLLTYEEVPPGADYGNCVSLHAEINALAWARGDTHGATIYITRAPCDWCAKVLQAFGVERVVYPND